jgi:hypothetical protein
MTLPRAEVGLWAAAVVLVSLAGIRGWATASALSSYASQAPPWESEGPSAVLIPRSDALVSASETFVARDPFRLERKPSGVAYSLALEGAPSPAPRPPRPVIVVVGILGGPPWEALLEGVPGRPGSTLVRRGDTLSGLRVRSITKDTVRITDMDTTWVLTVRRAW